MHYSRKVIFKLLLLFSPIEMIGQISKSEILIPLNLTFDHNTNKVTNQFFDNTSNNNKYNEIILDGKIGVGYSLTNNFILGFEYNHKLNTEVTFNQSNNKEYNKYPINNFGSFSRYYFINKKQGLFLTGSYLIAKPKAIFYWDKERISKASIKTKTIGLGYNFFVSKKICIEVITNYSSSNYDVQLKDLGVSNFYKSINLIKTNININLGLSYNLNKKGT